MAAPHSGSGSPAPQITRLRSLSPTERIPRAASATASLSQVVARRPATRTSPAPSGCRCGARVLGPGGRPPAGDAAPARHVLEPGEILLQDIGDHVVHV